MTYRDLTESVRMLVDLWDGAEKLDDAIPICKQARKTRSRSKARWWPVDGRSKASMRPWMRDQTLECRMPCRGGSGILLHTPLIQDSPEWIDEF